MKFTTTHASVIRGLLQDVTLTDPERVALGLLFKEYRELLIEHHGYDPLAARLPSYEVGLAKTITVVSEDFIQTLKENGASDDMIRRIREENKRRQEIEDSIDVLREARGR